MSTSGTFTALSVEEEDTPSIYFDVRNKVAPIDPLLYGGFTEFVLLSNAQNLRLTSISGTWVDAFTGDFMTLTTSMDL